MLTRVALVALATAGCAASDDGTGAGTAGDLPVLPVTPILRIGSVESPDTGFARPLGIDVDGQGRIYVLDAQDLRIRVYSPEGTLLRTIGKRGGGSGEFENAPAFGIVGDTLWATSGSRAVRFTLFNLAGDVLSTALANAVYIPLQPPITSWGMIIPRIMRPDGLFQAEMTGRAGGSSLGTPPVEHAATDTIMVPRLLYDASGEVVDTAGFEPVPPNPIPPPVEQVTIGTTSYRMRRPPSDDPIVVRALDGLIFIDRYRATNGDSAAFRVTRTKLAGDTLYSRSFAYRPTPYGDAYLDAFAWEIVQLPTGGFRLVNGMPDIPPMPDDSVAIFEVIRSRLRFPEFQPPVQRARLDSGDRLWILREDDGSGTALWVILEPDGSPFGVIRLPRDRDPRWSRGNELLLVEEAELGVPWVVKYRIGSPDRSG